MGQQLLNRLGQLHLCLLLAHYLAAEVVDGVGLLVELVHVLARLHLAAGHEGEVGVLGVLEGEEGQVLLVVLLDGGADGGGEEVEGREFLQVLEHVVEFAVGGGLDEILLYFLLLLAH